MTIEWQKSASPASRDMQDSVRPKHNKLGEISNSMPSRRVLPQRQTVNSLLFILWLSIALVGFSISGFAQSTSTSPLKLTELMYHPWESVDALSIEDPATAAGEAGEFIELLNSGESALDLSGYYWADGIEFVFPENTVLPPGGFLVLAKDPGQWADAGISHLSGPYDGALSNSGEQLRLVSPSGAIVLEMEYGDHGDWPAAADGAGHSLVFPFQYADSLDFEDPRNWKASRLRFGSPGKVDDPSALPNEAIQLAGPGAMGMYFKGFEEPSAGSLAWTELTFKAGDDWLEGAAGYGYSSNAGELARVNTLLPDMRGAYSSVYVRIPFEVTAAQIQRVSDLSLSMQYDDGFVVYLNGTRVAAVGVNGNPPAYDTLANSASDYPELEISLNDFINLLQPGTNLLAIQGHNGGLGNSSDFVIGPLLSATLQSPPDEANLVRQIQINEIFANGSATQPDWVEVYNPTEEALDLSGFFLSDDADHLDRYTLPPGSIVAAGGFLTLSADDFDFGLSSMGEAVFLTEPNREFVAAAYGFGPHPVGYSVARWPDGAADWFFSSTPSQGAANVVSPVSPVRINEIHYNSVEGQALEFVELKNATSSPVALGGWSFRGIRQKLSADLELPGNGLLVVADDVSEALDFYQLDPSMIAGNYSGSLSNSGERIALLNADDVVMDWVRYSDTPPWPVTADGLGASLERACRSELWSSPGDWVASPIGSPSPGQENSVSDCVSAQKVGLWINEIHYHPISQNVDDRDLEFLEIYNASEESVSLAGWGLGGSIEYYFAGSTEIGANEYMVIARSPDQLASAYGLDLSSIHGPYSSDLPNGGGEVFLFRPDGRVEDYVDYNDDTPWPTLADGFGAVDLKGNSLERVRYSDNSGPEDWMASLPDQPTPQKVNGRPQLTEAFPSVSSVTLFPLQPNPNQAPVLEVITQFGDSSTELRVEYWVDDPELDGEPTFAIPLDPLEAPNQSSSSKIWSVTLPEQAADSIVRYRIAMLSAGDWIPLDPSPDRDAFAWRAYFVGPVAETSQYETVRLFIRSSDWEDLIRFTAAGRVSGSQANPTWNNEVPAIFVGDGQVFDVSVRHQGSRWNRNNAQFISFPCPSHVVGQAQVRSWRIRFPSYRNYQGIDTLHLQKQGGWPQRVSFKFFEQAGVPAPRTGFRNLMINGCDFNPDAFMIERPGADLVQRWFDEVGDLFKSQGYTGDEGPWSWGDARLIRGSLNGYTESERYEYTYNRKTLGWKNSELDRNPDIVETMIEGLHAARAGGPAVLRDYLAKTFDVDKTLRYMCAINYVGTFDDMFQNHFLYRDATTGKWQMLPWDMDNTLGGAFGESNAHPFRGVDEARYGNVGNRSGWWNRIKDSFFIAYPEEFVSLFYYLNNTEFSPAALQPIIEEIAAEGGFGSGSVNSLMNHISSRHNYLNNTLPTLILPQSPELHLQRNFSKEGPLVLSWLANPSFDLETSLELELNDWAPILQPEPWIESDRMEAGRRTLELSPFAERLFFRLRRR